MIFEEPSHRRLQTQAVVRKHRIYLPRIGWFRMFLSQEIPVLLPL